MDFFQPYCNSVWTQNLKIPFRYVFHEELTQFWLKKKPEIPRETETNAKQAWWYKGTEILYSFEIQEKAFSLSQSTTYMDSGLQLLKVPLQFFLPDRSAIYTSCSNSNSRATINIYYLNLLYLKG